VQLTSGYYISIGDPSLHPYQSPALACGYGDLYVCDINVVGSQAELAVIDQKAGFPQCLADTAYTSGQNFGPLTGHTLCVTTTDRIAVCYVTGDTTQDTSAPVNGLTMDVTVYSKH